MKENKDIIDQFFKEHLKGETLPTNGVEWNNYKRYTKKRRYGKMMRYTIVTLASIIMLFSFNYFFKNNEVNTRNEKEVKEVKLNIESTPILNLDTTKTVIEKKPVSNITMSVIKKDSAISREKANFDNDSLFVSLENNVLKNDSILIDTLQIPEVIKTDTNTLVINKKVIHAYKKTIIKRKVLKTDTSKRNR